MAATADSSTYAQWVQCVPPWQYTTYGGRMGPSARHPKAAPYHVMIIYYICTYALHCHADCYMDRVHLYYNAIYPRRPPPMQPCSSHYVQFGEAGESNAARAGHLSRHKYPGGGSKPHALPTLRYLAG